MLNNQNETQMTEVNKNRYKITTETQIHKVRDNNHKDNWKNCKMAQHLQERGPVLLCNRNRLYLWWPWSGMGAGLSQYFFAISVSSVMVIYATLQALQWLFTELITEYCASSYSVQQSSLGHGLPNMVWNNCCSDPSLYGIYYMSVDWLVAHWKYFWKWCTIQGMFLHSDFEVAHFLQIMQNQYALAVVWKKNKKQTASTFIFMFYIHILAQCRARLLFILPS